MSTQRLYLSGELLPMWGAVKPGGEAAGLVYEVVGQVGVASYKQG